jgi:hypothetical protein
VSLADARNAPPPGEVFGAAPRHRREQPRYRMCRILEVREGGVLALACGHTATTKRAEPPKLYARCKTCPSPPVMTPEERARARGLARWDGHKRSGDLADKQRGYARKSAARIRAERLAAERMRVAEWRAGKKAA